MSLANDESATDRVIDPFEQSLAARVESGKAQAVRVARQRFAFLEAEIVAHAERNGVAPHDGEQAVRLDCLHPPRNAIDVDGLGLLTLEAEHHGLVGAVAATGRAERAVQMYRQVPDPVKYAHLLQFGRKQARSPHRADGMRAGGADTDREQVENADRHGCFEDARRGGPIIIYSERLPYHSGFVK